MKRKVKSSKGFTLVETVAAITVLTLVVAAVTASLIASIQFNARTEQRLQAELAVSNAVERLLAEGYDPDGSFDVSGASVSAYSEDFVTLKDEDDNNIDVVVGYFVTVSSTNPNVSTISVTAYVPAKEAP